MLISTNKKNNIAKSIALMLALVLAFSCILTACADKTARKDVEDLKGTVDTIGKDVETVTGKVDSVDKSAKDLADALKDYLKSADLAPEVAEILKDYEKTEDAHKFVNDLLGNYVTKEALDAALAGYYNKEAVDALVKNFITEEDVADFIAAYIKTPEAKTAISELLGETYLKTEDWNAATAEVLTALSNLNKITSSVSSDIYTVADWETYTGKVKEVLGVEIADFNTSTTLNGELWIKIIRAIDTEFFGVIEDLVTEIEKIPSAADEIAKINKMITDLQTASEGKIDTDDAKALADIKKAIVDFDAKYGFNATLITVETETVDFTLAFSGVAVADITSKLVVNSMVPGDATATPPVEARKFNTNADYVTTGGLKIADYVTMQTRYDTLVAWAEDIDEMIINLIATIGEQDTGLTDTMLDDIRATQKEVHGDAASADDDKKNGFIKANNGIDTPIENLKAYNYYEWLLGKMDYDQNKADAKAELGAYASDISDKFDSAAMNAAIADCVKAARTYIDSLKYDSYKTYKAAKDDLDAYVAGIKKDVDEILNTYRFDDTVLKAIAALEAEKTTLADADKYKTAFDIADAAIADINAVEVGEKSEENPYPYTKAYDAVVALQNKGILDVKLEAAKIDAKLVVLNYAKDYLNGGATAIFNGSEKNYDDVVAAIIAAAEATYADIDAVTVAAVADITAAIDAAVVDAKVDVDEAAYTEKLNIAMSNAMNEIWNTNKGAKEYTGSVAIDVTKIGDFAVDYVAEIYKIEMELGETAETDTWAEVEATAEAAVTAKLNAFKAEAEVAAYLAAITTP